MQIEYALTAVNAGATSLGIRATNGVVLATEKKLPSILVDESTVQKMSLLTPNVGLTYSGMGPDSRVLVRKARKSGQVYFRQYHEHIPVAQLCRETAAVMQEFTRERLRGGGGGGGMGPGVDRVLQLHVLAVPLLQERLGIDHVFADGCASEGGGAGGGGGCRGGEGGAIKPIHIRSTSSHCFQQSSSSTSPSRCCHGPTAPQPHRPTAPPRHTSPTAPEAFQAK